jgi:hypothetical protein
MLCTGCGKPLTLEEIEYYEVKCEQCERAWMQQIDNWLAGKEDQELDALYNIPFG